MGKDFGSGSISNINSTIFGSVFFTGSGSSGENDQIAVLTRVDIYITLVLSCPPLNRLSDLDPKQPKSDSAETFDSSSNNPDVVPHFTNDVRTGYDILMLWIK